MLLSSLLQSQDQNLLDPIPTSWFVNNEEEYYFPTKMPSSKFEKLGEQNAIPDTLWPKCEICVLGKVGEKLI